MLVCHCARKTDRDIHAAADAGARTFHEVALACGRAGACCGGCGEMIRAILRAREAAAMAAGALAATALPASSPATRCA